MIAREYLDTVDLMRRFVCEDCTRAGALARDGSDADAGAVDHARHALIARCSSSYENLRGQADRD